MKKRGIRYLPFVRRRGRKKSAKEKKKIASSLPLPRHRKKNGEEAEERRGLFRLSFLFLTCRGGESAQGKEKKGGGLPAAEFRLRLEKKERGMKGRGRSP